MEKPFSYIFSFKNYFVFVFGVIIAVFLTGYFVTSQFEKHIILSSQISGPYKVNRIISEMDNTIPIFGSSRAEGSFVPSLISENCFNFGLSGTQDDVILFMLKEELSKNKNEPILINFDLDGMNYSIGDIGNYLYNISNENVKLLLKDEYSPIYSIPIVKYYGKYDRYISAYLKEKESFGRKTDNGGVYYSQLRTEKYFNTLVEERIQTKTVFRNDKTLENEFYKLVESTNREIIFIVSPNHYSYYINFSGIDEINKFTKRYSELSNFHFLDFGKVDFPDSLFFNTTHLNYDGAVLFSEMLADSLKSRKILTNPGF